MAHSKKAASRANAKVSKRYRGGGHAYKKGGKMSYRTKPSKSKLRR